MKRAYSYWELFIIGVGGTLIVAADLWIVPLQASGAIPSGKMTHLWVDLAIVLLAAIGLIWLWNQRIRTTGIFQDRYQKLYVNNPQPMYIYDEASLKFLSVNQAAIEVYGYTEEEFLTMSLRDIRPTHEKSRLEKLLSENDPNVRRNGIWQHQTQDGKIRAVSITSDSILFGKKKARLVQATGVDELVRNKLQIEELNRLLREFRFAIERATMVATIDEEGKYVEVNENLIRACGYDRPFLLNEPFSLTFHPEHHIKPQDQFVQVLKNLREHHIWRGQLRHISQQGDEFWTQAYFVPFHAHTGRLGHAIVVMTDITDQKRSEEAIRNREAYLSSLVDSQSSYLIRVDRKGRFTFLNQSFTSKFGEVVSAGSDECFRILIDKEQFAACRRMGDDCFENPGKIVPLRLQLKDPDGSYVYTDWEFLGIQNDKGEVVEIQGIGQDVTEQVEGEKHILSQNQRLQEIAWISSHELRRPVANILGLIHLITHDDSVPKELIEPLSISAEQLDDIIRMIVQKSYDVGLREGVAGQGDEDCDDTA